MLTTRRFNKILLTVFFTLGLCLLMLATAGAQSLNFDHDFDTGFSLTGSHQTISCESCHIRGIFKGTPRNCDGCHNGSIAPGKSATHISSLNSCNDCHGTLAWIPVAQMDHGSVIGTCDSCHVKSSKHISTDGTCDSCHNSTAWSPVTQVDHTSVNGTCDSCHVSDKTATHIASSNICDSCHSPSGWIPVAQMDHGSVIGACDSCHVSDKSTTHILSSNT
jgi:hypothetical protein